MMATARAPGTCGELVQGKIDGMNFLVTCPVEIYSTVTVKLNNSGLVMVDADLPKVKHAVISTLELLENTHLGAEVFVSSLIPPGKGMASSTADISAACAAVAAALKIYLEPAEIAGIATSIEPTDGLMFDGITLFDHITGTHFRTLGNAPDIEIMVVDLGGIVDTLSFNANPQLNLLNKSKENVVRSALEKVERALKTGNRELMGEAATSSAFANQQMLFKPELEQIHKICLETGGLGINIAHSGTVVGMLYQKGCISSDLHGKLLDQGFTTLFNTRIINGGIQVLEEGCGDTSWKTLNIFTEAICGKLQKTTG